MSVSPQSVALWSPKGGVGKSVLAVSIALKIAEHQRTALIDGNPDNPDIVSLLQCPGQPNVSSWPEPADPAQLESHLVRHSNRLWVLPGPSRYVEEDTLKGETMDSILQACLHAAMTTVVDLGTALRDSTLTALDRVDQIIVPVTLDLLSLAPLKRLARELDLMRIPKSKFRVVINRLTDTREITVEDVRSFIEFPVVGVVPSARDLAAAVNRGEVGLALAGQSAVGKAVTALVKPFIQDQPEEVSEPERWRSISGWLGLRKGGA